MSPRPRLDQIRRPAILSAAASVIRERGLDGARIADVAAAAGTSPAAVLYWFSSKTELLNEALSAAEAGYYDELASELAGLESARERLALIIDTWPGQGDYSATLWIELWPRALRDDGLATVRAELDDRWRATIAEVVRYGQERGEFGPAEPRGFALLLAALLDGLAVQVALSDEEVTPKRVREMGLRLAERELGCEMEVTRC